MPAIAGWCCRLMLSSTSGASAVRC
ncbi:hypothetical protein F3J41_14590 [Pantoea sp. Ap-870]|nr:hypothetical protein [Pantoea dispersa]NIE53271.1 hypothetical protein [Pantoea sp. Ap-870]NIG13413.1 hypothetical protein [Pantoea sp. Cy-640]OWS73787.1 hypothetical protein CBW22_21300 [Pantoea sp. VS1]